MRLVRVFIEAASWLLVMTTVADAGPLMPAFLAIAGILKAGGLGALLLKALFAIALNVGLSLLKAALNKPKVQGVNFEVEIGDDSPIGFCTGTYATAGTRKYINTWGRVGKTPNAYVVDVIQYGDLPSYGVPGLWMNGKRATLLTDQAHADLGYPVQEFRDDKGVDHCWVRVKDGTATTVDAYLSATFGSHATLPWLPDMIGRGCPHLIVTSRFNTTLHKGGPPQLLIEPPAQKWYDLRKDTTVGGSGAHRWDDPATWEPTLNVVVQIYNIIRGVYYGDEWVFGGQNLSAYRLPASNWMAAANECDVSAIASGEAEEPQFRAGYEIRGDMEPLAVIEELLKACSGRLAEVGGRFKILVGGPGAAVYSFTDGDIVVTREQGFRPFPRLDETINAIEATYPEPGEMWAPKDAPSRYSDDLEAEDAGFRLAAGLQFAAVPFGIQVQRLMETMIAEERRFRLHTLYLPPDAYPLEPLDVVSWSSTRNGYSNKKFLIVRADGEPGMNQLVVLREIDPADYAGGGDYVAINPIPPGDYTPPEQVDPTFTAVGHIIKDAVGTNRRPSIKVTYAGDLDDVRAVEIQVRLDGATEIIYDYDIPYGEVGADDTSRDVILNGTFLPNEDYEVRGLLVPRSRRTAAWSGWIPVTTPNVRLGTDDLDDDLNDLFDWINDELTITLPGLIGSELAAEAAARNEQIQAEAAARIFDAANLADRFRQTEDSLHDVALVIAEQDFRNWNDRQELRREIQVEKENITASYNEAISAALTGDSAIVVQLETLEAQVDDVAAAVSTETAARVTSDLALATQITLLSAGSGDQFDTLKIWTFNSDAESWTGNGTPGVTAGYIRPANDASDPYIASPTGIGASGVEHRQVRMRVKKTGTPTWEGYLWWRGLADATWDAGRRVSFSEPSYSGGYANVTVNPEWTGDIDRIRIDLSSDQDATDYFEIDWVAIGNPSPGASLAALLAEETARADGDDALAALITTLTASLTDLEGDLAGQATILSTLQVTVETLDDDLTAVEALVDTIINVSLPGKASVTALEAIEAEVSALGGGGVVATGQIVASIRTELEYLGALIAEGMFADEQGNQASRKLVADAYQQLDTSIRAVDDELSIVATALTAVQAAIPGLAAASAVSALTSRVTVTESSIDVLSASVASVAAELTGKASATGVSELTARVTTAEGEIDAIAAAVTAIETELPNKAAASAVTALTTRVTTAEGDIIAVADALTALNSEVDGFSASGKFRVTTEATASGAQATIGISVAATGGGATKTAALFLDALSSGVSRIAMVADQIIITNAARTATVVPFAVVGGVVRMNVAHIGTVTAGVIKSADNKFIIDLDDGSLEIFV